MTCWQKILYGADALRECPKAFNQTYYSSFENCRQFCNSTARCKAFQHFSLGLFKQEKETINRRCGLDTSLSSYLKCDYPQCELFDQTFEPVRLYLSKERRPTVQTKKPLPKAFVYGEEGAKIKNNTFPLYCKYVEGETVFCIPDVEGVSVDRDDQFEPYKGAQNRYWTYAYKTDSFTTEQESFLPLERQLLSVEVLKTKHDRYSYTFSRRNPLNQTEVIGEPLHGNEIDESAFKLAQYGMHTKV